MYCNKSFGNIDLRSHSTQRCTGQISECLDLPFIKTCTLSKFVKTRHCRYIMKHDYATAWLNFPSDSVGLPLVDSLGDN